MTVLQRAARAIAQLTRCPTPTRDPATAAAPTVTADTRTITVETHDNGAGGARATARITYIGRGLDHRTRG